MHGSKAWMHVQLLSSSVSIHSIQFIQFNSFNSIQFIQFKQTNKQFIVVYIIVI